MMLLEMAASAFPARKAFYDPTVDQDISYEELFREARKKSQVLRESGTSRCVLLDTTNLGIPIALFSSAWAGIPYVPINYRLTLDEIDALLERVQPAFLITDGDREPRYRGRNALRVASRDEFRDATPINSNDDFHWSMEPDEVAVLLFTSGTTGIPKAAVMRQRHLCSYILGSVEFMSASEDEATLVSVPPYHIAGIGAILSSVYSGRRVVQMSQFDAGEWLQLVREHNVTTAFVVPTMLARIVKALDGRTIAGLPNLQSIAYGGGKMPRNIVERALDLFPETEFTNAYGLTETSSTITVLGPEEHREALSSRDIDVRRRLASVGTPLPGIELDIRDSDGNSLSEGSHGEVYVRGDQVSGEYEGRGSTLDTDGWFCTRDAGYIENGYLFLEGRSDDVIVRGGENLSPGEIEDVLLDHACVEDAAVVGIPSDEWGESVAAVVCLDGVVSVSELQDWVRNRMRSSRVPESIEFWEELPYNETGKLLRRVIRERLSP